MKVDILETDFGSIPAATCGKWIKDGAQKPKRKLTEADLARALKNILPPIQRIRKKK